MKKIVLLVLLAVNTASCFSQLVYFNRTGEGFSIGGSYSYYANPGHSSTSIGGIVSERFSKIFTGSIQMTYSQYKSEWYSYNNKSATTLIPSISVQIPNDKYIGVAAHVGYTKSELSDDIPLLLLSFEIYHRINADGSFQLIPFASISRPVKLKESYHKIKPTFAVGLNIAPRLGKKFMLVFGPQLNFFDGEKSLTGNLGLVIQ